MGTVNNSNDQEQLKRQEQEILNWVIKRMDEEILKREKNLSYARLQQIKAREQSLPDAYGLLVSSNWEKRFAAASINSIRISRDELYDYRLDLHLMDSQGTEDEANLKVGLHTYSAGNEIFVISWKQPVCRHYLLDNTSETYQGQVKDKNGVLHDTTYHLRLKRKVDIRFDKVRKVIHYFPLTEENKEIIADEFLQELLSRRTEAEFRNIVFSIQKKQGEIIQRPYTENLIIQGCAGSGKSMIMMHRLPILLFDNQQLSRNQIFIVTPSESYNRMIEKMMYQLEIQDLNTGTLEQYFDLIIRKYNRDPAALGKVRRTVLSGDQLRYCYSAECIDDIRETLQAKIVEGGVDLSEARNCFKDPYKIEPGKTPSADLMQWQLTLNRVLKDNHTVVGLYHARFIEVFKELREIHNMMAGRRIAVEQSIKRQIDSVQEDIGKQQLEIGKLDLNKNPKAFENRQKLISQLLEQYGKLYQQLGALSADQNYFAQIEEIDRYLTDAMRDICDITQPVRSYNEREVYVLIERRESLLAICKELTGRIGGLEEKYSYYTDSLQQRIAKAQKKFLDLSAVKTPYLPAAVRRMYKNAYDYYKALADTIIEDTYSVIAENAGIKKNGEKYEALPCTPYLYAQILYQYQGAPNAGKETLIAIDEAQTLTPAELDLINKVNGDTVVFNLFGDISQHIEGSKGIDSWAELEHIKSFRRFYLEENYRNARQITEYCNSNLGTNMQAINLDGGGIHRITSATSAASTLAALLTEDGREGSKAIIVKDEAEAASLSAALAKYQGRIHDISQGTDAINNSRWNLMTVSQAKGLEFGTVFACSAQMTQNEKYICYTRALDTLYIVESGEITQFDAAPAESRMREIHTESSSNIERHQPKKKKIIIVSGNAGRGIAAGSGSVKEFFEGAGLQVVDQRLKGGALWVVGSRQELENYVNAACSRFGISGNYTIGKAIGYRHGWYTKTRK